MCRMKLWILLVFMVCMGVTAVFSVEKASHQALRSLYNFEFQRADSILSEACQSDETHYLPHFVRSQYYWWRILTSPHDEALRQSYLESLENTKRRVLQKEQNNPDDRQKVFYMINLYALKARVYLMNDEYLKALGHLRNGVKYLEVSLGREESFPPFYLTSGLYNYMTKYGEKKYPMFRMYTLFYPEGDRDKGLTQLKKAAGSGDFAMQTEARYFLMKVFLELEKDYAKAFEYSHWLTEQYPGNLIFTYHHYQVLEKLNLKADAVTLKKEFFDNLHANSQLSNKQVRHLKKLL